MSWGNFDIDVRRKAGVEHWIWKLKKKLKRYTSFEKVFTNPALLIYYSCLGCTKFNIVSWMVKINITKAITAPPLSLCARIKLIPIFSMGRGEILLDWGDRNFCSNSMTFFYYYNYLKFFYFFKFGFIFQRGFCSVCHQIQLNGGFTCWHVLRLELFVNQSKFFFYAGCPSWSQITFKYIN